jgi:hypothetical protein
VISHRRTSVPGLHPNQSQKRVTPMVRRRPPKASVGPSKPSGNYSAPDPPNSPYCAIITGEGWVVERTESDGVRSTWPVIAWGIDALGQCHALPPMTDEFQTRPRIPADEQAIASTVRRMRPQPTTPNPGVDLYARVTNN